MGVTAAFNLNLLRHVNVILGSDFNPGAVAAYCLLQRSPLAHGNALGARVATTVCWPGGERRFDEGERIHTEDSYKYRPHAFRAMLSRAGFGQIRYWTDEREWFAVFCARA